MYPAPSRNQPSQAVVYPVLLQASLTFISYTGYFEQVIQWQTCAVLDTALLELFRACALGLGF